MPDEIVDGSVAALTAVALVAGPAARASGWAADAAVALARRWPPPRRPVLVDTAVGGDDVRAIHDAAGVANDEGLVDVAEYGLSLSSVRRDIGSSDVVTPGFYVPDGAVLRGVALWSRLLTEAAAGNTTLLVYVPADGDGVADLVRSLGAAIVLAEPAEAEYVVEALPSPYSVLSVLVPPPPAPAAGAELEDEPVVTAAGAEALGLGVEFTVADAADPPVAPGSEEDEPVVSAAGAEELGLGMEPAVIEEAAGPGDPAGASAEPAESPADPGADLGSGVDETVIAAAGAEQLLAGPDPDPRRLTDEEFERIRLPRDRESRDALIAELRERQRAARMAPPPAGLTSVDRSDDDVPGLPPGPSSDDVARSVAGDDNGDEVPDSPPRTLMPAGESDHVREMRLEASADDMTLDTLDPGPPGGADAADARSDAARHGGGPRAGGAAGGAGAAGHGGAGGDDGSAGWGPAPRRPSRLRKGLGWTLAIVLALSIVAGAWRYLSGRFAMGPQFGGAPADTTPVASPEPVEPASREVPLPYAVALEAHTDLATAFRRLDALGNEPGLAFHITPLEREGTLYYHIMSGPAPDSLSAEALRDTLVARGIKRAATPTDVRHQPLSFLVGDFGDRHNAEQSMSELRRLDLPAYYVIADAVDGYPMYRVHVGGFESPAEADVTRQLLRAAGVPDSLVTRTGSIYP